MRSDAMFLIYGYPIYRDVAIPRFRKCLGGYLTAKDAMYHAKEFLLKALLNELKNDEGLPINLIEVVIKLNKPHPSYGDELYYWTSDNSKSTEWCSFCESEVDISNCRISVCPECGFPIMPCNMCHHDLVDCSKECPFEFVDEWDFWKVR